MGAKPAIYQGTAIILEGKCEGAQGPCLAGTPNFDKDM
jgi:hypothetical protein